MPAGLSSIALLTPIIASNAIFSARRASRGVEAIDEKPIYGAMNMNIAAGQVFKGLKATQALAAAADPIIAEELSSFGKVLKSNNMLKCVGKVVDFTANNINPLIVATSGIKVLGSEDKVDVAAREALALTTMFSAEAAAKKVLGMPKIVNNKFIKGTSVFDKEEYKTVKKVVEKLNEKCDRVICNGKISLKGVPGALKGLAFVGASILGYKLGNAVADSILGPQQV